MPRKLILDVDTGTDDAVAIMLAALHPDLDLIGCTTANGNHDVERCTDNTLRVLNHIGRRDIPVYEGLRRPLARSEFPGPRFRHDIANPDFPLPATNLSKADGGAVEYLIETYRATTEEITLVPVAPLTNIAAALALDPKFVDRVPEVIIMGGGHSLGNETPSAEFNIWCDPEAAAVVFRAGFRKITLVTLDATVQGKLTELECHQLASSGSSAGRAVVDLIGQEVPIHDAVCVASIIDPEVISTRRLNVDVEVSGPLTVGRTVIDTRRHSDNVPNCDVAMGMSAARFARIVLETFAASSGQHA